MNFFSRQDWKRLVYGCRTHRHIPQSDSSLFVSISLIVLVFILYALLKANQDTQQRIPVC